jgi:WD40 repeat protein
VNDSSIEANVIIANRPKLYAKLMNVVAFDLDIAAFELNQTQDLIAIVAGRVVYLVRLSDWTVMGQLGRVDGGAHKGNIRDISIDQTCQYIASAGDDKRIAVWSIKKRVSERFVIFRNFSTFEAHGGAIFQIEFSGTEDNLITCSEDGLVLIWDWKSGTAISSFMRHPSAVRAFDFITFDFPIQVYCGRNDGYISVWNTDYLMRMDNIEPDTQWQIDAVDDSLLGHQNLKKGHSGIFDEIEI